MNRHLVAVSQISAVLVASSLGSVLAKLALREVPAFTFAWLQTAFAILLMAVYTFGWRGERIPRGLGAGVWASILWLGIGNFAIVRVLFMLALERLPATTHTYLVNFTGIATMLLSIVILRERPSVQQIAGALVAIAGLRVFFREIPPAAERIGLVYLGIGIVVLASTNNIARRLSVLGGHGLSNNLMSTLALCAGGLPIVLIGLSTDWPPPVHGFAHWNIIAFNGLVAIGFGLAVWNYVLRTLRSYEASILAASTVIYTALFAIPILGERLGADQIAGILLMILGLVLVVIQRRNFVTGPT
jgi:drug/metabolite transporter (DMT)-like permease